MDPESKSVSSQGNNATSLEAPRLDYAPEKVFGMFQDSSAVTGGRQSTKRSHKNDTWCFLENLMNKRRKPESNTSIKAAKDLVLLPDFLRSVSKLSSPVNVPSEIEDDHKFCQGQSCKDLAEGRAAVKICHHSDCQELNNMSPLLLCEDCDRDVHVGPATSHLRFDLPKTLRRTPSVKSNNSDSGTEDDSDPRFDKKYRSYASARKFFNISAGARKKARRHNTDDPGREFISVRFYQSDGSFQVEIVPALKGKSLKDSIEHMYENRNLSFDTHSVFLEASNTPLPLAFDTFPLGGNILHVRAIEEMKVDERIIAMAKQDRDDNDKKSAFTAIRKDSVNKMYSSQRSRKNIMAYLGEDEQKSLPPSPESTSIPKSKMPQRRSGLFQGPRLRDVNRPFQDVLGFYKVHGIENGFGAQDGEMEDQDNFQVEESWTMVISYSPDMPKKLRDQQEAIWELLTTEVSYISKLRVIIKLFQVCLEGLQGEKHLLEADKESLLNRRTELVSKCRHANRFIVDSVRLFGNIRQVYKANMEFWKKHLMPVVEKAREDKLPLSPDVLKNGFSKFAEIFFPYIQYCTEENHCLQYLKSKMKESEKFREYLEWCENHKLCNRLKLTDLLVKPMQRVTKYPLLLKAILKKTQEENQRQALEDMINKVETFVSKVNTTVRIRQERKKLLDVISRLDIYTPVDPVNDEVEKILWDHCSLNLEGSVPGLAEDEHRCVLKEGAMKLTEKQGRSDIYVFLFTDMFLITKLKRGIDKYRIIKQPYRLSKVVIHPLRDSSGFLFIYLNEYNVLANAFILTSAGSAGDQQEWIHAIMTAKRRYVSARMGQGSTYDFFDDSSLLPFQPSPQHSPQPSRKLLNTPETQYDYGSRSRSAELSLPIHPTTEEFPVRKPRASSNIEQKCNSAPSVSEATTHRPDNRVTRSRSDPKAEKNPRLAAITEKGKGSSSGRSDTYWDGTRPTSMVVDTLSTDFSMSSIMEERRSRSESLPLENEENSLRNERFRSTNSDTALSQKGESRTETVKACSSVPLMSSAVSVSPDTQVLRRVEDFTSDDNSTSSLSISSGNHLRDGSVSSSSASVSVDQSPSEPMLPSLDLSLGYKSQNDRTVGGSPFLSLQKHSDLKESSVDDTLPGMSIDQSDTRSLSETSYANVETTSTVEVQTDLITTTPTTSVAIQCDLMETLTHCHSGENCNGTTINFERAASVDALELDSLDGCSDSSNSSIGEKKPPKHPGLRHSMSETDICVSGRLDSNGYIHSRSLSDDAKPLTLQTKSTPTSPRLGKHMRQGPGMRALQVLSQNLETTIHNRSRSLGSKSQFNDANMPKPLKRMASSPRSLRRFALLNTSPKLERKATSGTKAAESQSNAPLPKHPGALSKLLKRSSWHVDTISELEQMEKGLAEAKKSSELSSSLTDVSKGKQKDKKSDENKKEKKSGKNDGGKKGGRKPNGKRWTISEIPGGVVSGPNLDKRGVRKHFLDESLMFGAPEYV